MAIKKYETYKDSGIEWIGEIPQGWEVIKLKHSLDSHAGGTWGSEPQNNEGDVICVRVADFDDKNGVVSRNKLTYRNYTSKELSTKTLSTHDLLLEKSGGGEKTPVGRVIRFNLDETATCSNFIERLTVKNDFSSDFIYYFFFSMYSKGINRKHFSQTTGIQNLNVSSYLDESFPLPPLAEQQAIAAYLDHKVGQIDSAVSSINAQIADLKAYRQSVISEAVTRGLDPNAPMKDSGIMWIGEIPQGWEVKPLKTTTNGKPSSFMDGDWIESPVITNDGIRYLTTGNVGVISYKEQGNGFISEQTFKDLNCSEVFPGDILISRLNLPLSRCCIVPELGYRIVTAVDNVIYRPDQKRFHKKFMVFLLNSPRYAEYVETLGRGATMQRISKTNLGNIKLPLPPLAEQQAIADYLDAKTAKIDASIKALEAKVSDLQALKQSTISEAVTGKVDVRDWKPSNN